MHDKDWRRNRWREIGHPPACTCHDCVQRRLSRQRSPPAPPPTPAPEPAPAPPPSEMAERIRLLEREEQRNRLEAEEAGRERARVRHRVAFRVAGPVAALLAVCVGLVVAGLASGRLADLLTQWPTLSELARSAQGTVTNDLAGFAVFAILMGVGVVVGVWTAVYLLAQAVHALLRH